MDILNRKDNMVLAHAELPEGWESRGANLEAYRNFCYPVKISAELEKGTSGVLYRTGEGYSWVGGADIRMPKTMFIDYMPFENVDTYIENYAKRLSALTGKEFELLEKREVPFDEEAGKEKVRQHAYREIKRQGGGNKIGIVKLYYDQRCLVYKVGDKRVAINTHIEAVKAGMVSKKLNERLKDKVQYGPDDDLMSLNPLQTLDWESNDIFVLVSDEEDFEKNYADFISIYESFKMDETYEQQSEAGKKDIQGKLFMSERFSRKMQAKKYAEWQNASSAEKKASDEYMKGWIERYL